MPISEQELTKAKMPVVAARVFLFAGVEYAPGNEFPCDETVEVTPQKMSSMLKARYLRIEEQPVKKAPKPKIKKDSKKAEKPKRVAKRRRTRKAKKG